MDPTRGNPLKTFITLIGLNWNKTVAPGDLVPVKPSQAITVQEEAIGVKRSPAVDLWENKFEIIFNLPKAIFDPYDQTKVTLKITASVTSSSSFTETKNPPRRTTYTISVGDILATSTVLLSKMYVTSNYQRTIIFIASGWLKKLFDPYKIRVDIETWQAARPEEFYVYETYNVDISIHINMYSARERVEPVNLDEQMPWPTGELETDDDIDLSSLFITPDSCPSCRCERHRDDFEFV